MSVSDEEDGNLAHFLESEVMSVVSDQEEERPTKRMRSEDDSMGNKNSIIGENSGVRTNENTSNANFSTSAKRIDSGILSKIPPELFQHILKFLSSEDLFSCSQVCKFLNKAASDESLWQRLYRLRWGLLPRTRNLRQSAWKKLYLQRDEKDMFKSVQNCQPEFRVYYIQMHSAKRSQAPLPSQVDDDLLIPDKTVSDQVSLWKRNKGLSDKPVADHACSGETCTYHQVGDVFVCERTGNIHVCDDACREVVNDQTDGTLVCQVSGRCFENLCFPPKDGSDSEEDPDVALDEPEPFMGAGRFARAYLLGYNCVSEKELEDTLKFC